MARAGAARSGIGLLAVASALVVVAVSSSPGSGPAAAAGQSLADLGVMIRLQVPASVTVGQTGVGASLVVESRSLLPVMVTGLTLDPACASQPSGLGCEPTGAIEARGPAVGQGLACPLSSFVVTSPDAHGRQSIVPTIPITLPPFANFASISCRIDFTLDVVRGSPGGQAHQLATATGFAIPGFEGTATASATTGVDRAPVTLTTSTDPPSASPGSPMRARATVSPAGASARLPAPTGDVTFTVHGPDRPTCSGAPFADPVTRPLENGQAVSPPLEPGRAGTYRWTARYSGDTSYGPALEACSASTTVQATPGPGAVAPVVEPSTTPVPDDPAPDPPEVVAPAGPRPSPPSTLAPYEPAAHAPEIVGLQVSAFALLAVLGSAGAAGAARAGRTGSGSGGRGQGERSAGAGERESGEVVFTEVESAEEGLAGVVGQQGAARGDRSSSWQWPGTEAIDRLSLTVPALVAARSPLLARLFNDAGYLRAIVGSASVVLPVAGGALGALAVGNVGGEALPPTFWLAMALAVIGVFDALAGFVGVAVFVAGVAGSGGLDTADDVRTMLGLATLWFAAPIIAGAARPLRRDPTLTFREHWERTADVTIASLVGAWAVMSILEGLPGLAGVELPIAERAGAAALVVLGALVLRMLVETLVAHWYPWRLSMVQPVGLREPGRGQRMAANLLVLAVFLFVSVSFLGPCWQLYVGGALFILPKVLGLVADRVPTFPVVNAILPRGIVEIVLMVAVGSILGALVLGAFASPLEAIRNSFVLLSLPGVVLAILSLFEEEQPPRERPWTYQLLGIPVLALGILLVLGVVSIG